MKMQVRRQTSEHCESDRIMKNRNRGFTLVELLIAVAILAIIAGPLFSNFVMARRTSVKAKRLGAATLAAQNIAEVVEASEIDDIHNALESVLSVTADPPVVSGSEIGIAVSDIGSGANAFTAQVTLDPTPFAGTNATPLADYQAFDAIFTQKRDQLEDPDFLAWTKYQNFILGFTDHVPDPTSVLRQITVDCEKRTVSGVDKLFVTLTYHYEFSYSFLGYDYTGTETTISGTFTLEEDEEPSYYIFPQGYIMSTAVPNVYLLLQPMYAGAWSFGSVEDRIQINNPEQIDMNLFLIKQKDVKATSDAALSAMEATYRCIISQKIPSGTDTDSDRATIYSNFKKDVTGSGATLPGVIYRLQHGDYVITTMPVFEYGVVSKNPVDRMYQVKVEIFDTDGELITTFTSAKLQ